MRKAILIVTILLVFSALCGYATLDDNETALTAAAYEETPAPAPVVEPVVKADAPVQAAKATPMKAAIPAVPVIEAEEKAEEKEVPDLATAHDIELIARTIWGEAEIVRKDEEPDEPPELPVMPGR